MTSSVTQPRAAAPPASPALIALALGSVYILWGSTYLGIRVALDELPPYTLGAVRFLLAGAVLYAIAGRHMDALERPGAREWLQQGTVGVLLLGVGNGGVILAEQHVPIGLVALLIATVPLWIALIAGTVLRERMSRRAVVSVAVGFGGVALLIAPGGAAAPLVMLAVLVAPLAWSIGSLYARHAARPPRALVGVAIQMLCAGGVFTAAALVAGEPWRDWGNVGWRAAAAIAYLVTFGSLVGYSAYVWLLHSAPLSLVATYAYVNPFVAVLLGAAFLGEGIGLRVLAGGGIIAMAVALVLGAGTGTAPAEVRVAGGDAGG